MRSGATKTLERKPVPPENTDSVALGRGQSRDSRNAHSHMRVQHYIHKSTETVFSINN